MTVLLTGAAGFIGSHVAEELIRRGHRVVGVDNFFRGKRSNLLGVIDSSSFQLIELDMACPGAHECLRLLCQDNGIEAVIHLAAINGTQYFYDRPWSVLDVNTNATRELMLALEETPVKYILYASSSEVYGDPARIPTAESCPILLNSASDRDSYASSKALGEFQVRLGSNDMGKDHLIVRIFNMYGPRLVATRYGQVVAEFIRRAMGRDPFTIIGDGSATRSFCHVEDGARAIVDLMERRVTGTVNLGNDQETSILELAALIHRQLNKPFAPIFLEGRPHDHQRRCPDLGRLRQYLPQFEPRSLDRGLQQTIAWFRDQ